MSIHREEITQMVLQDVKLGTRVRTSDGVELGLVKEISGDFLKVDAPLRADYWINADYVLGAGAEGVELTFAKGDLGAYKRDKPGLLDDEDPLSSEAAVDVVMGEEEQMEQRIRMERQLAEQRSELPDMGATIGEPVEDELERLDPDGDGIADNHEEAPDFMTKLYAGAIVGLETDSPLVAPVQSAMPAMETDFPYASAGVTRADAMRSNAPGRPVEQSNPYEPAAATPANPATSWPRGGWQASQPSSYGDEPTSSSPFRRVMLLGVGLAILLGVGVGGYTIRNRRKHRSFHV